MRSGVESPREDRLLNLEKESRKHTNKLGREGPEEQALLLEGAQSFEQ